MKRKPLIMAMVMLGGLFLLGGMLVPIPTEAAKESIKIGMSISTSGPFAFASMQGFRGVQLWVAEVNKRGGIPVRELGRGLPVELVYHDDRSDKEVTVRMYEKLIVEDKVDATIANFSSTLGLAAAPITEKYGKVMMIWASAASPIYEQGFKYVISGSQISTRDVPRPMVAHAHEVLKMKTVAMIYVDQPAFVDFAINAKDEAEKRGMKVVQYEMFPMGAKDFSVMLQKARAAKPDAFMMFAYVDDQITAVKQMRELDINFPYANLVYVTLEDWWKALGKDGLYFSGISNWHPDLNHQVNVGFTNQEMIAKHHQMFPNEHVTFETALAYVNVVVLEEMIKRAGSLDSAKLKQAALELSGKLDTLLGRYELDETGRQLGMPFMPMQRVPDPATGTSKLTILYPEAVATGKAVYPMPTWAEKRK
jgi:branched-chain amino acid transport system substrate-binding protein